MPLKSESLPDVRCVRRPSDGGPGYAAPSAAGQPNKPQDAALASCGSLGRPSVLAMGLAHAHTFFFSGNCNGFCLGFPGLYSFISFMMILNLISSEFLFSNFFLRTKI